MGDYIPTAPLTDEDKKANGNLPGMGGVYNPVNFALYHFAGNNPVRYVDPDGDYDRTAAITYAHQWALGRNSEYDMREPPLVWIKPTDDCANFSSQSLNAGGIGARSDWYFNSGSFGIIGNRTDKNYSQNWTTARGLSSWLRNTPGILSGESHLNSNFTDADTKALIDGGKVKVGDLVGFSKDSDGKDIHHFGVITGIKDGKILFSEHTNDNRDKPLGPGTGDKSIVIFHIEDDAK